MLSNSNLPPGVTDNDIERAAGWEPESERTARTPGLSPHCSRARSDMTPCVLAGVTGASYAWASDGRCVGCGRDAAQIRADGEVPSVPAAECGISAGALLDEVAYLKTVIAAAAEAIESFMETHGGRGWRDWQGKLDSESDPKGMYRRMFVVLEAAGRL